MLIYFVRHGQTDYNLQGIIQGHIDTPLNDTGRNEARLLAEYLREVPFTEAWSSSLSRARETGEILIAQQKGLTLQTDPGLKERDLGALSGKRWTPGTRLGPEVESSADFRNRVLEWADKFFSLRTEVPGPVLIISHGAYLQSLLHVLIRSFGFATDGVDLNAHCLNTCVMRVEANYRNGQWEGRILSWGEVTHLGDRAADLRVADDIRSTARKALSS